MLFKFLHNPCSCVLSSSLKPCFQIPIQITCFMGQKLEKMGQQRPKDELLYHSAIVGDLNAIKALSQDGAGLEWIDNEGKTALIVACMNPGLLAIAKTLIEMGANINAYRPGRNAGTPLHHASKRGLEQTVKLLLSHGANAFVRNDDCQTPLDVARTKGYTLVVRAIESHICYFSGWLREFYGPDFLGGLFAPQLLSRKIWVVIIPWGSGNAGKHPKFELAIYSAFQDAVPRTVISLWKAKIEDPKFHKSDPAVVVFDQLTKTQLASGTEGDKVQLQWLYSACKGINLVMPSSTLRDSQTSTTSATRPTDGESNNHQSSVANDANGWKDSKTVENYNGWGTPVVSARPEPSCSSGWIEDLANSKPAVPADEPELNSSESPKKDYSGLSLPDSKPASERNEGCNPALTESSSTGWLDEVPKDEYNGWGGPDSKPVVSKSEGVTTLTDLPSTVHGSSNFIHPVSAVPSAPPIPIPEDGIEVEEGPIRYPSLDLDRVSLSIDPVTQYGASSTRDNSMDVGSSSSCIICWEAPIEGACIPCGHMAGCMSCLNEIKANKGLCPVCRANINQVIRLFAV